MAGIIEGLVKKVYNEEKGGVQWGNVVGGGVGALAGLLMGNYVSGAGGQAGTWLGLVATVLLTGAGMKFGAHLMSDEREPPAGASREPRSQSHAQVRQHESALGSSQLHSLGGLSTPDVPKLQGAHLQKSGGLGKSGGLH